MLELKEPSKLPNILILEFSILLLLFLLVKISDNFELLFLLGSIDKSYFRTFKLFILLLILIFWKIFVFIYLLLLILFISFIFGILFKSIIL